jgi:hypothetical protein
MKKIVLYLFWMAAAQLAYGQSLSISNYRLLTAQLDSILTNDQKYRSMIDDIEAKHGPESSEMKDLWETIQKNDSINSIQVTNILDKYGWLGPDKVGDRGSAALFLVIQHADIKTQEKYLPMMRLERRESQRVIIPLRYSSAKNLARSCFTAVFFFVPTIARTSSWVFPPRVFPSGPSALK